MKWYLRFLGVAALAFAVLFELEVIRYDELRLRQRDMLIDQLEQDNLSCTNQLSNLAFGAR